MSTQEVTRGAREGWLPAYRVGHVWRFDREVALAWLKAHPAATDCRFEWDYSNPDEDTRTGA